MKSLSKIFFLAFFVNNLLSYSVCYLTVCNLSKITLVHEIVSFLILSNLPFQLKRGKWRKHNSRMLGLQNSLGWRLCLMIDILRSARFVWRPSRSTGLDEVRWLPIKSATVFKMEAQTPRKHLPIRNKQPLKFQTQVLSALQPLQPPWPKESWCARLRYIEHFR